VSVAHRCLWPGEGVVHSLRRAARAARAERVLGLPIVDAEVEKHVALAARIAVPQAVQAFPDYRRAPNTRVEAPHHHIRAARRQDASGPDGKVVAGAGRERFALETQLVLLLLPRKNWKRAYDRIAHGEATFGIRRRLADRHHRDGGYVGREAEIDKRGIR